MSEELFVSAWKRGINIVGKEFFNIKASSLESAKKKWQMEPNYQFIKNEMSSYSHGKQVLLGLMYSFYDPECGQDILIQAQSPNFVQSLFILNEEARTIISELWLYHTGW